MCSCLRFLAPVAPVPGRDLGVPRPRHTIRTIRMRVQASKFPEEEDVEPEDIGRHKLPHLLFCSMISFNGESE